MLYLHRQRECHLCSTRHIVLVIFFLYVSGTIFKIVPYEPSANPKQAKIVHETLYINAKSAGGPNLTHFDVRSAPVDILLCV